MWIKNILVFVFVLVTLIVLTYNHLLKLQHNLVYEPKSSFIWEPKNDNIKYEDLFIEVKNDESVTKTIKKIEYINAWYFENNIDRDTVLFIHGSYGNMSYYKHMIEMCRTIDCNLLLFDYRGYGKSTGLTNQKSIIQDGKIVYDEITKKVPPEKIILWGESLGGSVAVDLASKYKVKKMILFSTFSSLDDVIRYHQDSIFTNTIASISSFITNTLPSKDKIINAKEPILIVHSIEDKKIPYKCAEVLYERIPAHTEKRIIKIKGGHAAPIIKDLQIKEIINFFDPRYSTPQNIHNITLLLNSLAFDDYEKIIDKCMTN